MLPCAHTSPTCCFCPINDPNPGCQRAQNLLLLVQHRGKMGGLCLASAVVAGNLPIRSCCPGGCEVFSNRSFGNQAAPHVISSVVQVVTCSCPNITRGRANWGGEAEEGCAGQGLPARGAAPPLHRNAFPAGK